MRPFAALRADDHHVLHHQRRAGEADRHLLGIQQLGVPHLLAGLQVERDQAAIDRADIEIALSDGDAAVVRRVRLLGDQFLVELGRVGPDRSAGRAVQRPDTAVGARIVQHAVNRQRRRLHTARGALRKMHPRDFEILDVAGVDLVEPAVMVGLVGAVIGRPVLLRRFGIQRRRVLGVRRRGSEQGSHGKRGAAAEISLVKSHLYPPCADFLFGRIVVATLAVVVCQYLMGSRVSDLPELPSRRAGCRSSRRSKEQAEVRAMSALCCPQRCRRGAP